MAAPTYAVMRDRGDARLLCHVLRIVDGEAFFCAHVTLAEGETDTDMVSRITRTLALAMAAGSPAPAAPPAPAPAKPAAAPAAPVARVATPAPAGPAQPAAPTRLTPSPAKPFGNYLDAAEALDVAAALATVTPPGENLDDLTRSSPPAPSPTRGGAP